jgi:ribonucleotide monophosphatase NagD (HAD superfamily)
MDIALGRLGGSTTVLVRTGISATAKVGQVDRPDHVLEDIGGLLDLP